MAAAQSMTVAHCQINVQTRHNLLYHAVQYDTAVRFKPRFLSSQLLIVQLRLCYCFYLYVNVQLMKRDIVIAVIYCYITTDFHYAKGDSRLSAWGVLCYKGLVLRTTSIYILA